MALGIAAGSSSLVAEQVTFEKDIAPMLQRHCGKCHGAGKRESGLDVRRRFSLLAGGDSGPAIVVGDAEKSLLIEVLEDELMPPEGQPRPSREQLKLLRRWIATGALTRATKEPPLPDGGSPTPSFTKGQREHWAFQPISTPLPPTFRRGADLTKVDSSWRRTPIDAFVLDGLNRKGWSPAAPATRREWIRRVYFDLIGLPPSPMAVETFISDSSPDAFERVVDSLLASPRYGERWGQHWLDVVRFAESEGFEYDRHLPDAWRFRDFVIKAFNQDLPFDEFVRLQLAGDELETPSQFQRAASIFHRLGAVRRNAGNPDIALSRNEVLTERTNIIGEAFLALSVGCARCHNHKLEPITQKDYYRLQAYFAATQEHNFVLADSNKLSAWEREKKHIEEQIKQRKSELTKAEGAERQNQLQQEIKELTATLPKHLPTIPGIRNDDRTPIHVLRRGIWEQKGIAVGPRPLSILTSSDVPELPADVSRPRTQLANWMVDPHNPLTARVIVNRIWQHHFGRGLVSTPNDFGTHGDRPSHPQLLDWLATRLLKNHWRIKPLHRMIVLSSVYRQSSHNVRSAEAVALDPGNRWLWRFSRRRLSAEEIRDAMLFVSGELSRQAGGPSVMAPVDEDLIALLYKPEQWQVSREAEAHRRRSIYLIAKRNLRLPFMEAFDAPALQTSCPRRGASTHASQALAMLNGDFANQTAKAFANKLHRESGGRPNEIIQLAFQLTTGHDPSPEQRMLALQFLKDEPLSEFALAMLNLNEFIYVR